MSKYGFEELQMLYEGGFRGDAVNRNTNYDYGGYNARHLSAEWPALRGIKSEPIGIPTGDFYEGEEELISKHTIQQKIGELLQDAEAKGMGYAVEHLYELLKLIDDHKK